ncbi:hypothetical protein [Dactylosporangium sp. CA-092794]|uniref:hypothetical protein n=1 Tax=Dactylosporangium sp. CA-092794 TaxID=3239929 RepID=UPI003D9430C3
MSDYDGGEQLDPGYTGNDQPETLDPGYTGNDQPDVYGGHDVDYGQYEAGQEHGSLDQLHHAAGSEADHDSQFNTFEQDHHAAESTAFSQGHHVEYDQPAAVHYESDDFTNYSHNAEVDDHVFAAEGSESSHQAEFSDLDALRERFDSDFASGTEFHGEGGAAGISAVSS